jgi:hypothetical protein
MPSARAVGWIAALLATIAACFARRPCIGIACNPACPREAARDSSSRCACATGGAPVLGACVPPEIADAYCGRAARYDGRGCLFRACAEGSVLDASTGACVSRSSVVSAEVKVCGEGDTTIVTEGRPVCAPLDAACPRGTARAGAVCARPPICPPGTLVVGAECRPIVTTPTKGDLPRVDIGAWATIAIGPDGGLGSTDLCRPLWIRPDAFGLVHGGFSVLILDIALTVPDQDLTRIFVRVSGEIRAGPSNARGNAREPAPTGTTAPAGRPLPVDGQALAFDSVSTLVEVLRGLGGEASTANVELRVSCAMSP